MQQKLFSIDQMSDIVSTLLSTKKRLIYVAGSSASGKSFFAKQLAQALIDAGHTALSLSSDDYYSNTTRLQYLLYGTFDHPNLIEYDLLAETIHDLFTTGKGQVPQYSFKESRRVGTKPVQGPFEYLIVEGLYTINELPILHDPFKIYVDSPSEELVFRRLVRDQERLSEPLAMQINNLSRVFPMWTIYGQPQKKKADVVVDNTFEILSTTGKKSTYVEFDTVRSKLGSLQKRLYITDYEYNDIQNTNGTIIISEVYKQKHGLLDHVTISRRSVTTSGDKKQQYESIKMSMYEPGTLTQLHTLLQLAGLSLQNVSKKIESTYLQEGKEIVVKERRGKMFLKIEEV